MNNSTVLVPSAKSVPFSINQKSSVVQVQNDTVGHDSQPSASASSSYWSKTFAISTLPFILWGCPFFLLTKQESPLQHPTISTQSWLKRMFDCKTPINCFLSIILLIPTVIVNIYIIYVFCDLINSLFIAGKYEISMFEDLLEFFRFVPILLPLNYVWFRGYKINNIVCLLNHTHKVNGGVGGSYRFRLIIMLAVLACLHTVRYFSYQKYLLKGGLGFWTLLERVVEFSLDIFCSLMLPMYCTFCYAIKFELLTIKGVVYKLLSKRVPPDVSHLNKIKALYTHAADHILDTNSLFSLYLSLTLVITIFGTIWDADSLWKNLGAGLLQMYGSGKSIWAVLFDMIVGGGGESGDGEDTPISNTTSRMTPAEIREVNADIACIVVTYALIFFTVWQAVLTNDCAREVHVWLNDFVTGGGGTDVISVLVDMGDNTKEEVLARELQPPLVWAQNKKFGDGSSDEFLEKFRALKAYIHVRMQTEKPALLNITLVGLLVPALSGRLRLYRLLF